MASKTQELLLEEIGGLFDGETAGLDASAGGDLDLAQSLTETIQQLGEAAPVVMANPPADAAESPAGTNADGKSSTTTNNTVLEQSGGLFRDETTGPGGAASDGSELTQTLTQTVNQLGQIAAGVTANSPDSAAVTPAGTNTRGGSSTTINSSSESGTSVGSLATTFLEGGLGIVPLITGLVSLFTGGSDAPPALEKYVMPSSLSFESVDTGGGLSAADFDQSGAPRVYNPAADSASASGGNAVASSGGAPTVSGGGASPQITVNVQAMDAQSFMDYSSQIAQAVRGAMLNLSSLNDVVNEL